MPSRICLQSTASIFRHVRCIRFCDRTRTRTGRSYVHCKWCITRTDHTRYDGANHRLALLTSPQLSDDPHKLAHTGIHHSAFEYATIDVLLETYTRLKGVGIVPHACLDHGMTTSFYYVDPDGNSVELQVDNFGDWGQSSAWMGSAPQFAANPIGAPVDPAQMVSARLAGATFAALHQRAYAGEFEPAGPLDLRVPLGDPTQAHS